ncbi:hypothetical protein QZH41_008498 [Actinostola sp. cb2023]|nr:hypothetical protein QZH41_008498 [Actinostola sp. cb2023]
MNGGSKEKRKEEIKGRSKERWKEEMKRGNKERRTLLGAERFRDVLPWDGDADISFLLTEEKSLVHEELLNYDISSNVLRAFYEGESIDYMRWVQRKGLINGREAIILHKYYPDSVLKHENAIVLYHHKLESFPLSWVKPTKTIDFHGVKLAIPNNPDSLLRHRYPWTYYTGLSIPYKWKCWIPCWIRTADGC